jgi:hypothetical protein
MSQGHEPLRCSLDDVRSAIMSARSHEASLDMHNCILTTGEKLWADVEDMLNDCFYWKANSFLGLRDAFGDDMPEVYLEAEREFYTEMKVVTDDIEEGKRINKVKEGHIVNRIMEVDYL